MYLMLHIIYAAVNLTALYYLGEKLRLGPWLCVVGSLLGIPLSLLTGMWGTLVICVVTIGLMIRTIYQGTWAKEPWASRKGGK